jgi:hypothetical protein
LLVIYFKILSDIEEYLRRIVNKSLADMLDRFVIFFINVLIHVLTGEVLLAKLDVFGIYIIVLF